MLLDHFVRNLAAYASLYRCNENLRCSEEWEVASELCVDDFREGAELREHGHKGF